MQIPSGGRGGIPPETPLPPRPHFLLAVLGIEGTKAKGAQGEKNEGAVADERVRTDFLEKSSDLGCVSAVCQNTGFLAVF